ncbi:hypothetical protein [Streptomyces ipomoeae]|uniref:hypothetical protein n=1 Tax=Streptomyces ipomoeae TaxID=103232 RepID=UPI0038D41038
MLIDDERETLTRWERRRTSSQAPALRCRIVLGGGPRKITDDQAEEVVVKTLETKPKNQAENATHWSTRSMAKEVGLPQSAIARIWRTLGLKPPLADTFKLSKDPQFIEKVRDVVGLYLAPPGHALVLCADDKTQMVGIVRSPCGPPERPGPPAR